MNEMKKCPNCGAIQQASRQTCIDCGTVLPEAHTAFAKELDELAEESLAGKMEWNDRTSITYKVSLCLTFLAVLIAACDVVLIIRFGSTHRVSGLAVAIACGLYTVLMMLFPAFMRRFERRYGDVGEGTRDYVTNRDRIRRLIVILAATIVAAGLTVWFVVEMPEIVKNPYVSDNGGTVNFTIY